MHIYIYNNTMAYSSIHIYVYILYSTSYILYESEVYTKSCFRHVCSYLLGAYVCAYIYIYIERERDVSVIYTHTYMYVQALH